MNSELLPRVQDDRLDASCEVAVPTFLYHPQHGARIFQLAPGDALPAGWHDTPAAFADRQPAEGKAHGPGGKGRAPGRRKAAGKESSPADKPVRLHRGRRKVARPNGHSPAGTS